MIILTVTQIEDYYKCPYMYFLKYVLKKRIEIDEASIQWGKVIHEVIKVFLEEHGNDGNFNISRFNFYYKRLVNIFAEKFNCLVESLPSNLRNFYFKKFALLLRNFLLYEFKYREVSNFRKILFLEKSEELLMDGKVCIRAKFDRIDEHEDGICIIDYKVGSGYGPVLSRLNDGSLRLNYVQLPFYSVIYRDFVKKIGIVKLDVSNLKIYEYFEIIDEKLKENFRNIFNYLIDGILKNKFWLYREDTCRFDGYTRCDYSKYCHRVTLSAFSPFLIKKD